MKRMLISLLALVAAALNVDPAQAETTLEKIGRTGPSPSAPEPALPPSPTSTKKISGWAFLLTSWSSSSCRPLRRKSASP